MSVGGGVAAPLCLRRSPIENEKQKSFVGLLKGGVGRGGRAFLMLLFGTSDVYGVRQGTEMKKVN